MIAKVRSNYWKCTYKFNILIPKSVKEALLLDDKTGTDLWQKAMEKEMKNVMPAFTLLEQDENVPIGYQHKDCHLILNVKMNFTRKVQFVAGGHMTETPGLLTYSSVVSCDSVSICINSGSIEQLRCSCCRYW